MLYYRITIQSSIMNILLSVYPVILAIICILGAPAWILKMRKRGGWGTGLSQRIGLYRNLDFKPHKNSDYYHAVSVGETIMALKVIAEIEKDHPTYRSVIACTTATGHEIARNQSSENCLIIYAPLDFSILLKGLFSQLTPRQIILVDSELWPNLLRFAQRKSIPLKIINGRISDRSYSKFTKFRNILRPLLKHVSVVCVDGETQASRWTDLGVPASHIHDVGNLKFDFNGNQIEPPTEFIEQLDTFPTTRSKILLASTHAPEEEEIASELKKLPTDFTLMVAPRHAERRDQVQSILEKLDYTVTRRSNFQKPSNEASHAFLLDTTGELAQWTSLADIVIAGKSWSSKRGGQNPFEAVSQRKLVICGPHMENFEPLFSELVSQNGVIQLNDIQELVPTLNKIMNSDQITTIAQKGENYLLTKLGATQKTASLIQR